MLVVLFNLLLAGFGLAAVVAPLAWYVQRELAPARVSHRAVFAGGGWR